MVRTLEDLTKWSREEDANLRILFWKLVVLPQLNLSMWVIADLYLKETNCRRTLCAVCFNFVSTAN